MDTVEVLMTKTSFGDMRRGTNVIICSLNKVAPESCMTVAHASSMLGWCPIWNKRHELTVTFK